MSVEWEAESTGYYFFVFRAIFINESCLAATSLGFLGFQLLCEMLPIIIFFLLCSITVSVDLRVSRISAI